MPVWLSHIIVAKAVSHSLRSLIPVTQRKPTRPSRTAAGTLGNDLSTLRSVFFMPEMMLGGCKNFLPMLASSGSDDMVIADVDNDIFLPWSGMLKLTGPESPTVGTAITAVAVTHNMNVQKKIFNGLANKVFSPLRFLALTFSTSLQKLPKQRPTVHSTRQTSCLVLEIPP